MHASKGDALLQTRSKVNWFLLAAMALPLVLLAGCKSEAAPETRVTVQAEHPKQGAIAEHILAEAVLAPLAQAAIAPKISAPVRKFYVQRGSMVKEGQLLATLENSDLAAAALDNKGSYMAAEAAFATATRAQVPEDTLKAESDVAQTKANLDLNLSIVKSRKQLFAEGAIPGRDLDTAQAALVQAQAAYDAAAKHLESVRSVSREAALKSAQGQLTSAEGKFKGAAAQVSYSEIRSPINGVVTDRSLFAGETAAAGAPLLTVMDTSSLLAKTHLAQNLAQRIKVGDDASVEVQGVSDPVAAKVALVSPALDPGSTPVKVSITGRTDPKAWQVPAKSILTAQDGSKSVMVVGTDGAAHRKPVTLGLEDAENVQITEGLTPDDLVITVGAYGLEDGVKVKVGDAAGDKSSGKDGGTE
jgi:multidrug resistance efflux pump